MEKLLVMAMGKSNGRVRFRYRVTSIIDETDKTLVAKSTTIIPEPDGTDIIHVDKSVIGNVISNGMLDIRVFDVISTENVDKAEVRKWYKIMKSAAMENIKHQNRKLRELYKEVENITL